MAISFWGDGGKRMPCPQTLTGWSMLSKVRASGGNNKSRNLYMSTVKAGWRHTLPDYNNHQLTLLRVDQCCPRCGHTEEIIMHAIFTCLPALQCWALSNIPTSPSSFPYGNLMEKVDYLFWRLKNWGISEEVYRSYPWIMWYIWKARNDKIFNNLDRSPTDILDIVYKESLERSTANGSEDVSMDNRAYGVIHEPATTTFTCFIDWSWKVDELTSGVGWVLELQDDTIDLLGIQGRRRGISSSSSYEDA